MNPDREPLSPPTSPPPEEDEEYGAEVSDSNCEDSYTPANGSDAKDEDSGSAAEDNYDDDDDEGNIPSSPPTSVETMSKNGQNRIVSGDLSGDNSADSYRAPAVETEDEDDQDENRHTQREYFQNHYEGGNEAFTQKKNWENSSQWEDEDGEPVHSRLSSPPPHMARVQSQSSSRKSPAPGPPQFPARPRQNTSSAKSNLSHQFSNRRSPASRASSGSYDHRERDHREDQKKPPLVLLHVTLLLLPGAEEVVLRHLTPTTIERGVLVEHPRGDYNLLEELILDGLGLDEDFVEESAETEEPEEKTWEQALNITPISPPKKAWQVRVYASNGLMTPGAWKRVWAEMERIDVEIWPRGYDRKRNSIRSFGFGGHSRGTSASNISAILPAEECATDGATEFEERNGFVANDGRRKSYSGSIPRRRNSNNSELVASSAPVPTAPGRARTPSMVSKSRRGRTRVSSTSATNFNFDLNRFFTPRTVMIGAVINLGLFLYFTIFRFVNVSAWKDQISGISFPFGGNGEISGIEVNYIADERCPVDANSEGCSPMESSTTEEIVTEGEQQSLVDGEKIEGEQDPEVVADPEIGSMDSEASAAQEDAEKEKDQDGLDDDITTPDLGSQLEIELEDQPAKEDQDAEGETELLIELEPKSVEESLEEAQEAEIKTDTEAEAVIEAETAEEEVGEKSRFSFRGLFGGSN